MPGYLSNYDETGLPTMFILQGPWTLPSGEQSWLRRWKQRIFVVEPTGEFEDDPNVTDKKFPGNPTK